MESTLRSLHRRPCHGRQTVARPLSGFGSLSECHQYVTTHHRDPVFRRHRANASLPRFLPLQRLSIAKSHIPPAVPISPVTLRPRGFSPPRRLAPLATFRACSIPVPLMGFDPSRPRSSPGAVRPLGRRAPRGFASTMKLRPPLQGLPHQAKPAAGSGVNQAPADACPLGLSRSEASCSQQWRMLTHPLIPSRAFPARPQADRTAGTPGFFAAGSATVLSRDR
jgi:hypothetical protein